MSIEDFGKNHIAIGQKIKSLAIIDNELAFEFESGMRLALYDDGQQCCESRYMNTDDDLAHFNCF